MDLVIRARRLIDGTGAQPIEDAGVVIEKDRIVAVGRFVDLATPRNMRVIALPDHTLAPGLIDVHSHATIDTSGNEHAQVSLSEAEVALRAAYLLGRDLRAGVTTIRTLGDRKFADILLRRLQSEGVVRAPRMQVAGHLMQSSLVDVSVTEATADDEDTLRHYIRQTVRAGADWVKFYATPNSSAADPTMAIYSRAEVDCIFAEARRIGKPVSVHCHGGITADWCIEHRVDSLEHGVYLTELQFRAMAEHNIPLVPTTSVILVKPEAGASPRVMESKAKARSYLRLARKHGVRCIPGTDAVHGALGSELLVMIDCGWSVLEAIKAATLDAAHLLRIGEAIGTLRAGKLADIVAFRGDPVRDPSALLQVDLVVQSGHVVAVDDAVAGMVAVGQ